MSDPNTPTPSDPSADRTPPPGDPRQSPPGAVPPQPGYAQQPQPGFVPPQPGQAPQGYAPAPAGAPLTPEQDRNIAMWAHLGGILFILPSLIIYLVFKDRGPFTRQESKEALNWQITLIIVTVALSIVFSIISGIVIGIALASGNPGLLAFSSILALVGWLPWAVNVVFSIIGALRAKDGVAYRYPFAFRFIK